MLKQSAMMEGGKHGCLGHSDQRWGLQGNEKEVRFHGNQACKGQGASLAKDPKPDEVGRLKKKKHNWQQRQAGYDKGGQEKSFSTIVRRLDIFLGQWEDADLMQRAA